VVSHFPIASGKIVLRAFTLADAPAKAVIDNEPDVRNYLGSPSRLEDDIALFERDGYGLVAIVAVASQSVVGYAKLQRPDWGPKLGLELVVALAKGARCKGYGTAAGRALITLACGPLGETAVVGRVSTNNVDSVKLIDRLGMSKVGQREDLLDGTQYIYAYSCGVS
jgi:RimJ/RimL family protein N-acetyltransferase